VLEKRGYNEFKKLTAGFESSSLMKESDSSPAVRLKLSEKQHQKIFSAGLIALYQSPGLSAIKKAKREKTRQRRTDRQQGYRILV
jgi:hypothetical protein